MINRCKFCGTTEDILFSYTYGRVCRKCLIECKTKDTKVLDYDEWVRKELMCGKIPKAVIDSAGKYIQYAYEQRGKLNYGQ